MQVPRVIRIEAAAPSKPALGTSCNGCGVCCLAEPCPLGMVWGLRRQGSCAALNWDEVAGMYRCGLLLRVQSWPVLARLVRRWIGVGQGCDCQWEPTGTMASSVVLNSPEDESHGSP